MTISQINPKRVDQIITIGLKRSASMVFVLLVAAFITEGKLFDSMIMGGLFAWSVLLSAGFLVAFLLRHVKLIPPDDN